ncbi:unnamed protein product [Closterium sp. NIES-53]
MSRVDSALPLTPPRSPSPRLPYRPCTWTSEAPNPVLGPRQERKFLIVVDNFSRYTKVFPLRWKANVPYVLEPWLLARGGAQCLCGLCLHSDHGAADYRVWGSLAHVRALGVNTLPARIRACVFLGFTLNSSGWHFYDPVTLQFFASHNVTFDESASYYRSRPHRGYEAFSPPLFHTLETPPRRPGSPPPPPQSCPASSGVSHVTPQSSPPQCPVLVVSGGAGGAAAEGGGTGAAGPGCAGSGGAGGVRVETTPVEDTAVLTRQPHPTSPPGFPSVPRFPPRSSLRLVAAEPEGVPVEGTGDTGGDVTGVSGSGGAGARDTGIATPTPRTVRFLTRAQRLLQLEREGQQRAPSVPLPCRRSVSPCSPDRVPPPPPPPVLPQPPKSSLIVFHYPLSDYLRASRPIVFRVLSALVTHPSAPPSSVSALVTTVTSFASSHRLDYVANLVSGPARSPSSRGAPVFPVEVLEDWQFELSFLAAAVPHFCALLLAREGGPDALDIPIPRTHAKVFLGPWASYRIAAQEVEMASYWSIGTYVDAVPPPRTNVVSGMWLYKVKRLTGSPLVFKACYVARGFSQREGVDFFQTFAPTPKMTTLRVLLYIALQRDYQLHSLDFMGVCTSRFGIPWSEDTMPGVHLVGGVANRVGPQKMGRMGMDHGGAGNLHYKAYVSLSNPILLWGPRKRSGLCDALLAAEPSKYVGSKLTPTVGVETKDTTATIALSGEEPPDQRRSHLGPL